MRLLFIALGIGFTVWCFMTHQAPWLCIANVVLDVLLVLSFIKDNR